jgi:hypothetical protein
MNVKTFWESGDNNAGRKLSRGKEKNLATTGYFNGRVRSSAKRIHRVTIALIAQNAEFAIGTLYKFFENKEELYRRWSSSGLNNTREPSCKPSSRLATKLNDCGNTYWPKTTCFKPTPFHSAFLAETLGPRFQPQGGVGLKNCVPNTSNCESWLRS